MYNVQFYSTIYGKCMFHELKFWTLPLLIEPRHDKTNKISVRPAKTQISLGICPVWSESLLCTQWVAKDPSFPHADSEYSDQIGRMPRLIFAWRTLTLLVLSCRGSIIKFTMAFDTFSDVRQFKEFSSPVRTSELFLLHTSIQKNR